MFGRAASAAGDLRMMLGVMSARELLVLPVLLDSCPLGGVQNRFGLRRPGLRERAIAQFVEGVVPERDRRTRRVEPERVRAGPVFRKLLAARQSDRQQFRRSQPDMLLSRAGGLRVTMRAEGARSQVERIEAAAFAQRAHQFRFLEARACKDAR